MVAMSLAAIALIRSVDTTNAIVGNLAFRLASILPANASIEQAASALFADADILLAPHLTDKDNNSPAENYLACRQGLPLCPGPAEDARGVPAVLQKKSTALTLTKKFDDTVLTGTQVTYLIERMCLEPGTGDAGQLRPRASEGEPWRHNRRRECRRCKRSVLSRHRACRRTQEHRIVRSGDAEIRPAQG